MTDGVFTAFTRVLINVQNSNNHAPTFPHAVYDVDTAENMAAGRQIAEVKALDPDMGIYGDVKYDISSEDLKEFFRIDEESGEMNYTIVLLHTYTYLVNSLHCLPTAIQRHSSIYGYI